MPDFTDDLMDLRVSQAIAPDDAMYRPESKDHYFQVGLSNLFLLQNMLRNRHNFYGGDAPVERILDFGCGHGRVARFIAAGFPDAEVYVTDLLKRGMEWCAENFGCKPLDGELPRGFFDLVWLGSVFTHLPEDAAEALLERLLACLRPNGVLAFSTQGRFSIERLRVHDWSAENKRVFVHYRLPREQIEKVVTQYHESGYGYVDYARRNGYGVCVAKPEWYSQRILCRPDFTQIFFQERGSDNHQDVLGFMRVNILEERKGPLWRLASRYAA